MNETSTISRIYDLKTIGLSSVISDLDKVIGKLDQVSAAKRALNDTKGGLLDPQAIAAVSTQIDKLNAIQAETLQQLRELNTVTKQGVTQQADYSDALLKVATEQKGVTASMQQSTAALGNNLSATTAGVTKLQASLSGTQATAINYDNAISALGGRLATLRDEATATGQQLKLLGDEYRKNQISEEDYQAENEGLTVQLQQTKTQITEVTAAMTALNKVYNPALIEGESEALALNSAELRERNNLLKLQAQAEIAAEGSINEARSQAALYRKELNSLNLTTEEGIARQKELIVTIAELDAFIKDNADLYTKQKINIGNYPTVGAELAAVRGEMQKLVVAGEQESAEFTKLTAKAQELSAAMQVVKEETITTTSTMARFGGIVERMGLRFIANLVIFQVAIELFTYLKDKITEASVAQEKYNDAIKQAGDDVFATATKEQEHSRILLAIAQDTKTSMSIRVEAVQKLQSEYPNYLGNLSQEAILTGKVTKETEALNKALFNKALMEANMQKVGIAAKSYSDIQDKIDEEQKKLDEANNKFDTYSASKSTNQYAVNAKVRAAMDAETAKREIANLKEKQAAFRQEMEKYAKLAEQFGIDAAGVIVTPSKQKKDKQPHDYTNELLAAQKKLTDNIAKEQELRLQLEMAEQKEIFSSTQNSLNDRLKAYAVYAADEKKILQLQTGAEIQDVQDKLDQIKKIEEKDKSKRSVEENVLLINKDQLNKQMDDIQAAYMLRLQTLSTSINSDIAGITKSSLDAEFAVIDAELNKKYTDITNKYNISKEDVYKSGKSSKYKDKHLGKLEEGETVEKDEAKLVDDAEKINDTEIKIREAHNMQLVELEADLRNQLVGLYKQEADDRKKYQADVNKKDKDNEAIRKEIADAAIGVAQQMVASYMELLSKEDAAREEMARRTLDTNYKTQQALTQSKAEAIANEKSHDLAERQLNKQKMQDENKRARSQLAISYVISLAKALEKGFPAGVIEAAADTVAFAFAESQLSKAPAYKDGTGSGSHPGGFAWVGDGGESELAKIGNSYYITPSTPTLVNMPAGSQVAPLSKLGGYSGMMGEQLRAPVFHSSSTAGGGGSDMQELKGMMGAMIAHVSNIRVTQQNPATIKNSIDRSRFKQVGL